MIPFNKVITNEFKSHIIKFRNAKPIGKNKERLAESLKKGKIEIALNDIYSMMCVRMCV